MFELARPKIKIADLAHRVALCTMHDVVEKNGTMALSRETVTWLWAAIDTALNLSSFIAPTGYAITNPITQATHRIMIRAQSGLEITTAAWVYETRRKSSPRWYKILGFTESESWILLPTHLVERSDQALPPIENMLQAQPSRVQL